MKTIDTQKLGNLPKVFYRFMEMCDGIDLDKDNCVFDIDEYSRGEYETRSEVSIEDNSPNGSKRITFSYVKKVNLAPLENEIYYLKDDISIGESAYVEEFVLRYFTAYEQGNSYLVDYIFKKNDKLEKTEENIKRLLEKEGKNSYDSIVKSLLMCEEEYAQLIADREMLVPEGSLVLPGIDIIYARNMLTGGIHIANGGIILFTAQLDENNLVHNIKLNRYESLADIVYSMDEGKLDYLYLSETSLESDGILPISSISLDFDELLSDNNMSDYSKKPIGAIYKLKDILASKVLEYEDSKKR